MRYKDQMDSWIAPRLTDGLGNRLFQLAAAAHFSKKTGKQLCFYIPRIQPSVHSDCSILFDLFPRIQKVWSSKGLVTLQEDPAKFTSYTEFDTIKNENCILSGYFQCWKYTEGIDFCPAFDRVISAERRSAIQPSPESWWIHIRLGDYKHLAHHQCTSEAYWKTALGKVPNGATVLVFSDEPEEAAKLLTALGISHCRFAVAKGLSAIETLYVMSLCGGGCIGSNSTFSWWGQYFSKARANGNPCIVPRKWHRHVKEEDTDVFGPWHTIVDC